jgi:hypothetical protein
MAVITRQQAWFPDFGTIFSDIRILFPCEVGVSDWVVGSAMNIHVRTMYVPFGRAQETLYLKVSN